MGIKYKPSTTSKENEKAIKDPLILEYNIKGEQFRNGDITTEEFKAFKKDWKARHKIAMNNVVKDRVYIEDNDNEQ